MQVIVENPNTIVIDVDQGRAGRGIQNITYTEVSGQYFLIVTYTDGTTETLGPLVVTGGAAFLLGGATGSIPYQSAPNTTVFLPIGTQNQVVVAGATVPQYTSALTGLTVNNSAIGNTTPSTGAFTNLSASGTFALTGDQVQISEGGTGQTTANGAFNALAPSQTGNAGKYLKTDGTNSSWDQLDISTADITGTLPIANGGTGQTTANSALNALLPTQAAQSGKYLKTDGTNASWDQLDISTADITGVLPIANGGTGASTAAGARANLSAAILGTNNDITSLTGITGGISTPDFVQFDTTATEANAVGKVYWDAAQGTLDLGLLGGNVVSRIGQSLVAYVTNAEAVTITKGQAVYLFGAQGNRATVKLASNLTDATSAKTFGVVAENIPANGTGFVMCQGVLEGLNLGAYTAGDTLYLGATPGSLTATKPYAPNHLVYVGLVERANAGNGQLYVKVQNGYELDEIHDVQIINPQNGQTILYDASTSLWKNANLTAGTGVSVTNGAASVTIGNTGVLSFSGGTTGLTPATSTTGAVTLGGTLAVASGGTGATTAGGALTNLGAASSAITISAGTGLTGGGDLTANRTLSIANTAVTAASYGSASSVGTFTVNAQGQLTAAASTPIAIANTQVSGLGTMSTQNSNSVTITGGSITGITDLAIADGGTGASDAPTARTNLGLGTSATLNAGVALGVATLDAGGTVPLTQLPASIQGGVSYQGSWNAATNTPTITSGVGSKGYYYVVSVAGSTNIDGITDWLPGDWIIFNGTVWQKIDNTDAVASVNGYTGVVVLNSADVGAAPTSRTITAGTGLTGGGNLSANRTISIDNTTVAAGSYGSASSVGTFTVNGQGQLTAAASTPIAITNTQVSGLGTMSTQNASAVAITGGSITGITDLAVADGGTGASDAATARTNLGAAASATTISAGTGLSGGGDLSANRTLSIANTTVTAASYGSASSVGTFTVNAQGQLTAAASTPIAIANTQVSGLGTMSTQNANAVAITGGSIDGVTIGGSTTGAGSFTTLTTSSTVTLNGGTANGVAYLNGSKVLTTGSVFAFNGTNVNLGTTGSTNKLLIDTAVSNAGNIQLPRGGFIGFSNAADNGNSEYIFANGGNLELGINGSTRVTVASNLLTVVPGANIEGLTVGRGAGAVSTNTAVGASALAANTTGNGATAVGASALAGVNISAYATAVGYNALNANTSGEANAGFGAYSLFKTTTGAYNTGAGVGALQNNITGANNTAVGYTALVNNTASNNTAVGYQAAYLNTTGTSNTVVGYQAMSSQTVTGAGNSVFGSTAALNISSGQNNTAIGTNAMRHQTTGSQNTAVGYGSLGLQNSPTNYAFSNSTAVGSDALAWNQVSNNTAVGYQAGYSNTTGANQLFVGRAAGYSTTTGGGNTALGDAAFYYNISGTNNVAVGTAALQNNNSSSNNTAVGYQAAYLGNGEARVMIGYQAGYANQGGNNSVGVGYAALSSETSGGNNIGIGYGACSVTNGYANVAVGTQAMNGNNAGAYQNTAIGQQALRNVTSANNTAVGFQAGYGNTTGATNTYIGAQAGFYNITGGYNTYLGWAAGFNSTGSFNTFVGARNGSGVACAELMTTGSSNTIIGGYSGNQNGLDIRTASNYIVLSDGDGNPQFVHRKDFGVAINDRPQISSSYVDSQNKSVINLYEGTNGNTEIVSGYSTADFVVGTGGTSGNIAYSANGGSYLSIASGLMAIVGTTFTIGSNTYTVTSESSEGFVYCTPSAAGEAATGTLVGLRYATEGFRVYDNRTAQFKSTVGVGGTAGSTSGAGITFPATQNASSNANTLDDYEEGTWTPTDNSGAALTFTINSSKYTKIGRAVTINLEMTWPSTANGNIVTVSLPFAADANVRAGLSAFSNVAGEVNFYIDGSANFVLYDDTGTQITNATMSTKYLIVSITYFT